MEGLFLRDAQVGPCRSGRRTLVLTWLRTLPPALGGRGLGHRGHPPWARYCRRSREDGRSFANRQGDVMRRWTAVGVVCANALASGAVLLALLSYGGLNTEMCTRFQRA